MIDQMTPREMEAYAIAVQARATLRRRGLTYDQIEAMRRDLVAEGPGGPLSAGRDWRLAVATLDAVLALPRGDGD
jgi:hypothetical protein